MIAPNSCGVIPQYLNPTEVHNLLTVFKKFDATEADYGNETRGVAPDHLGYLWFKKVLFNRMQQDINPDMKLIFGVYLNCTTPFPVHVDLKEIPPGGKHYFSFLIPYSVDHSIDLVENGSTIFYNGTDSNNLSFMNEIIWRTGDLMYWDSHLYHVSGDFISKGFTSKQAIVIHTYV